MQRWLMKLTCILGSDNGKPWLFCEPIIHVALDDNFNQILYLLMWLNCEQQHKMNYKHVLFWNQWITLNPSDDKNKLYLTDDHGTGLFIKDVRKDLFSHFKLFPVSLSNFFLG